MSAWRTLVRLAHAMDLSKTGLSSSEAYALLDAVEAGEPAGSPMSPQRIEIAKHYLEAVAK